MCLSCDFRSTLQFMFFRPWSQRLWLIRLSWIWVRWFFQNFAMTAAWSAVMPPCFLVWAVRKASSWFKSMSAEAIDCRKTKGAKGKSLLNRGLRGHIFRVGQILDLKGVVQTNKVMQITWYLSLKLSLQVSTTQPRFLLHSSWRAAGWLQQLPLGIQPWYGYGIARRFLPISWPFPHCARHSQMMDTATNTVSGLALPWWEQERWYKRGWAETGEGTTTSEAHCNIPSFICHLHTTHKAAKLVNAAPVKQGLQQQQEHQSFKGESKCKMQLLFSSVLFYP